LALALLSKKGSKKRNWAVFAGSLIPDAAIYIWAPYQHFVNGVSGQTMWRELYFQEPMQNLIAYFNSIPIYGALAAIGYVIRDKTWGKFLLFFGLPHLYIWLLTCRCIIMTLIAISGRSRIGALSRLFPIMNMTTMRALWVSSKLPLQ